jgi:hypothetical protein
MCDNQKGKLEVQFRYGLTMKVTANLFAEGILSQVEA